MIRLHQGKLWRTGTAQRDFWGPAPLSVQVHAGATVLYRDSEHLVIFPGDPTQHSVQDITDFLTTLVKPTWPWRTPKAKAAQPSSISKVPLVTNSAPAKYDDDQYESWVRKLMQEPETIKMLAEQNDSWLARIDREIVWHDPEPTPPAPQEPEASESTPVKKDENPA